MPYTEHWGCCPALPGPGQCSAAMPTALRPSVRLAGSLRAALPPRLPLARRCSPRCCPHRPGSVPAERWGQLPQGNGEMALLRPAVGARLSPGAGGPQRLPCCSPAPPAYLEPSVTRPGKRAAPAYAPIDVPAHTWRSLLDQGSHSSAALRSGQASTLLFCPVFVGYKTLSPAPA